MRQARRSPKKAPRISVLKAIRRAKIILARHESESYYVDNYCCRSCKEEVEVHWIVHFVRGVVLNHESIV